VAGEHRDPLPDALRAAALLGVLMVNAAGWLSSPWGAVLGDDAARQGGLALAVQGLQAFAVQGKAYPILAFLFGMSLVLAQRQGPREVAATRARTRQQRLLLLGVLHGVLIYFGDILTMYALIGWLLLRHVHAPWARLRRLLRRALGWALAVALVLAAITVAGLLALPAAQADAAGVADVEPSLATVASWPAFWALNASGYLFIQLGTLLVGFAVLRLLMLAGIAAARLRWLTHPRWQPQRQRLLRRWALPALLANGLYAWAYVAFSGQRDMLGLVEALGFSTGPLLSMVMVVAVAQHLKHPPLLQALAPLGRNTLTLYVGHGLICLLLFSHMGLGLRPGALGMLVFSLTLWGAAWWAARAGAGRRWPLEAWMARR
jgi:uncharacterized protein